MANKLIRRADGSMNELAAAIRTDAAELAGAIDAERALEGADSRVRGIGWQIPITTFAAGSKLERHLFRPPGSAGAAREPLLVPRRGEELADLRQRQVVEVSCLPP
jgi:hypothetical protein